MPSAAVIAAKLRNFADEIEHATGEEKVMLLLEERGITVSFMT